MFRNESKGIVIPQQEHARLAGFLAMIWGNEKFSAPSIGLESLSIGIAHHHQGYGALDTIDFKKADPDQIVNILWADCQKTTWNVDADLVNLYHQLRLVDRRISRVGASPQLENLRSQIDKQMKQNLGDSIYKENDFLWADRITDICDRTAFLFCSGGLHEEDVPVYQNRAGQSTVTVKITVGETVKVRPWPFKVGPLHRDIVGYQESSYPHHLIPEMLEFHASD